MLFSSFKNLVSFFRQSNSGLTKSNTSNQFCKPVVGLCALLCMSLWISAAQAQQQMKTNLVSGQVIPASSHDAGYRDSAELTAEATDTDSEGQTVISTSLGDDNRALNTPVGLVDWVEVQIRVVTQGAERPIASDAAVSSYQTAAWLLSDGSVVDANFDISLASDERTLTIPTGDEGLTFDADTQELYVLVNHRIHLAIMSDAAVPADSGGVYDHNFTTGESQAYNGSTALKDNAGVGQFAMRVGDLDGSNDVAQQDIANVLRPNIGSRGYTTSSDVDFDADTIASSDDPLVRRNIGAQPQISY